MKKLNLLLILVIAMGQISAQDNLQNWKQNILKKFEQLRVQIKYSEFNCEDIDNLKRIIPEGEERERLISLMEDLKKRCEEYKKGQISSENMERAINMAINYVEQKISSANISERKFEQFVSESSRKAPDRKKSFRSQKGRNQNSIQQIYKFIKLGFIFLLFAQLIVSGVLVILIVLTNKNLSVALKEDSERKLQRHVSRISNLLKSEQDILIGELRGIKSILMELRRKTGDFQQEMISYIQDIQSKLQSPSIVQTQPSYSLKKEEDFIQRQQEEIEEIEEMKFAEEFNYSLLQHARSLMDAFRKRPDLKKRLLKEGFFGRKIVELIETFIKEVSSLQVVNHREFKQRFRGLFDEMWELAGRLTPALEKEVKNLLRELLSGMGILVIEPQRGELFNDREMETPKFKGAKVDKLRRIGYKVKITNEVIRKAEVDTMPDITF